MSEIYVHNAQGEQVLYPEERIAELLASGELSPEAFYWRDGMANWQPLRTFHPRSPSFVPARRTEPLPSLTGYIPQPAQAVSSANAATPREAGARPSRRYHFRRYPDPLTTILQVLIVLGIGIAVFQLANALVRYNLLSTEDFARTNPPIDTPAQGPTLWSNLPALLGPMGEKLILASMALGLTLIVPYCMWIYQAVINSRNFSSIVSFKPGWAIGCHFVPAINLYMPCQVMQEIWKVSRNPRTWHNDPASFLVLIWWILWVVHFFLALVTALLVAKATVYNDVVTAALVYLVQLTLNLAFYGVFFAVITVIVQRQKRLVAAGRRNPSPPPSPASASTPVS